MAIKFTPESTVIIKNYEEQLQDVQEAITGIMKNGQQYAITGSRSKQSASLEQLQKERTRLLRLIAGQNKKVGGRNQADNSGYYGNDQTDLQGV